LDIVDISVIIPVWNEVENLAAIVEILVGNSPCPARIVLGDGGSAGDTIGIERDLPGRHEIVNLVETGDAWLGWARNLGIAASSTKWILLVDAGVHSDSSLVQESGEAFEPSSGARMIIG
jgi:glycosyltransferase involved in cell wall biosynthesis